MISTRIVDNDMGAVMKVPLTGKGTIHGITFSADIVIGQEKDKASGKMVDVIKRYIVPEFEIGLVEIVSNDMGLSKFKDHLEEHLGDVTVEEKFVLMYNEYITPINKSGKVRY